MAANLYINADNMVHYDEARRADTGAFLNSGTCTCTVRVAVSGTEPPDCAAVSGASNISMPYITGSEGHYAGSIPSTVTLAKGTKYWVCVTFNEDSFDDFRVLEYTGNYRGAN